MESHHIELNEKSRKVDQICVQLTKKQKNQRYILVMASNFYTHKHL